MGRRNTIYVSGLIVAVFCGIGLCLENPSVGNPIGPGTVPPTAYKSGLTPSVNPINTSGNLVVTGNVANGMQFRGVVPYNSPTSFWAPASSLQHTSGGIDTFLSNSAGSQNLGTSSGGLTPYYSPAWTVTTTQPGGSGVVTTGGSGSNSFAGTNLPSAQTGYYRTGYNSQIDRRPLSMSQQDLEKLVESDTSKYPTGGEPGSQPQEQFWRGVGINIQRKEDASNAGAKPKTDNEASLETLLGVKAQKVRDGQGKREADKEGLSGHIENALKPGQGTDIYEQMKIQFGKPLDATQGKPFDSAPLDNARGGQGKPAAKQTETNEPTTSVPKVSATPEEFAKAYKSFAARSDDKFNQHIKAAEGFMKQGRFYRAADAYTLASIYKPNDPLGYAGKSVALFGSGEYLSSALFLARALEIFPEYAKVKIDLVGMIGDKDTVENRILEARDWMDKSDSGELEFLLSYIHYQMDRLEFARQSIEAAAKKMPNSPAVAAMKKAIDERLAKP
jgi:tetratricopeptide (TPR) repeat protein